MNLISGKATKLDMIVLSLDSIDDNRDMFLAQSWKDYRLMLPGNILENKPQKSVKIKFHHNTPERLT